MKSSPVGVAGRCGVAIFVIVTVCLIPAGSWAVAPSVSIQPVSMTVRAGDVFDLYVNVNNAAGVYGYYFRVTFDASLLDCTGAASGTLPAYFQWAAPVFNAQPGSVTVAGQGSRAISGSGQLVKLTFQANADALDGQTSPVHIAAAEFNDAAILLVAHGAVTITRPVLVTIPATLQGPPDSEMLVPVRLEDVSGPVDGFYLDITYDTDFLDYLSVTKGALMTASWSQPIENAVPGRVQLAAQGTTPITGSGELLVLHFHIKAYADLGQTTTLHFAAADLNDGALDTATTDGAIKVDMGLPATSVGALVCIMLLIFIWKTRNQESSFPKVISMGDR